MSENEAGRPTEYKQEYCEQLIAHLAEGLSYESFAGVIGVARSTLFNWEKLKNDDDSLRYPEWLEAKEIGFAKCQLFWERLGRNMTLGLKGEQTDPNTGKKTEVDYTKGNSTTWIFNMKNRFNWKDKVDHTTDDKPMQEKVFMIPSNGREKG